MAFECKIAADSLAPCGARLTTYIVSYPRAIHSEIMTHRMLTKSSASSRAIPVEKLIERVSVDPWIPQYIGVNQKGMQPGEELSEASREEAIITWLNARDRAVSAAKDLVSLKVHKGVVNRLLEPWMWITVIISGTEWENFFGLRTHEAAEPHFQHIARMMRDARDASVPRALKGGQWHLPLIFEEDYQPAQELTLSRVFAGSMPRIPVLELATMDMLVKVSVGRCARVSYLNHEGKRDLQADIDLHDRLMVQRPLHAAPAEHVAQAMDWPEWWWLNTNHAYRGTVQSLQALVMSIRRAPLNPLYRMTMDDLQNETCLAQMRSGNYLGFFQYRKSLADEHIGGLMP